MFKIVVDEETARKEVSDFLDARKMFPKEREKRQPAIDAVVEAITLGFVTIGSDGAIQQKLVEPVGSYSELTWKARVPAEAMNRALSQAKAADQGSRNMVYITTYTDTLTATINKLEATDRGIADAIAFFLQ